MAKGLLALALDIVTRYSLGWTPALSMGGLPALPALGRGRLGLGSASKALSISGPAISRVRGPALSISGPCQAWELCGSVRRAPVLVVSDPGTLFVVMPAALYIRVGALCRALVRVPTLYISGPSSL